MVIDDRLWAKEQNLRWRYPAICHAIDSALIAEVLWDDYLCDAQRDVVMRGLGTDDLAYARSVLGWFAGVHDLGKLTPGFQRQLDPKDLPDYPAPPGGLGTPHGRATHLTLPGILLTITGSGSSQDRKIAGRIGQLLGGHHGVFYPTVRAAESRERMTADPDLGGGAWDAQREELVRAVRSVVGDPALPERLGEDAALLIAGVVMIADWLASQESFIKRWGDPEGWDRSGPWWPIHADRVRAVAPGVVRAAGLYRATWRSVPFTSAFDLAEPRPLQRSLLDSLPSLVTGPGLLLITAPTGEGKTEAGLGSARIIGAAAGIDGLAVLLPTMATADQMYERVRAYLERCLVENASLTLAHSMAWLNPKYASTEPGDQFDEVVSDSKAGDRLEESSTTAATEWLRGRNRALNARLSVMTVDQALAAMVRGRRNALRLLGLSGKVLIIDEVHAYDAYMHSLMRRLLHWLGVLRVPVVLMSATLTGRIANQLITDYLDGAGIDQLTDLDACPYPGWTYADATTGKVHHQPVPVDRTWDLTVDRIPIRYSGDADQAGSRLSALRDLIEPATNEDGRVLVMCNTVRDAQATHQSLAEWFDTLPNAPDLYLLHARFPAWRRAEITEEITTRFGKNGSGAPAVLVATQVVEQSLDLDFDLVVSDLAPLAMLLQRAGRGHRHERDRPSWARDPRLVVLIPVNDTGALSVPPAFAAVYAKSLLIRTDDVLTELDGPIAVPGQVQDLVDSIYPNEFADPDDEQADELRDADIELWGQNAAMEAMATMVAVPRLTKMTSLADWSAWDIDERLLATRLGAESELLVCCYVDEHGDLWLDPERHGTPLPTVGSGPKGRFTRDDLATIYRSTVPLRSGGWIHRLDDRHKPPDTWEKHGLLRYLHLLPLEAAADGTELTKVGDETWSLSHQQGLRSP